MAQTIIGLDIGAFSVKVATISASFRSFSWTGYHEYEIPHGERDRPERAAAEVLKQVSAQLKNASSVVVTALPSDRVMSRFIDLPFTDPKRVDSVLGFELEGHLPLSVEDMIYSYQLAEEHDDDASSVFAAAVSREYMTRHLESLQNVGLDPRIITLNTTVYMNLYDHLVGHGTVAFVDIGHRTTNICVVEDGVLRMARSIGRGGMAVTQSIADKLSLSFEEAEALKHSEGALPFGPLQVDSKISDACIEALNPVVLGIRQSLVAHQKEHTPISQILVSGGGGKLRSLLPWLQKQLGVTVKRTPMEKLEFNRSAERSTQVSCATEGVGLALTQVAGSKHVASINFRRGEYGYEGDFQYIKEKLKSLALMAAMLLIVAAGNAIVRNNAIEQQLNQQYSMLADFSKTYLGKKYTSFNKALKAVSRPPSDDEQPELFPPMTAVAVLDRITSIQQDINESSPTATTAGGPFQRTPPAPARMDKLRDRLKDLRNSRAAPPKGIGRLPDPRMLEPALGKPDSSRASRRSFGPRMGSNQPGPRSGQSDEIDALMGEDGEPSEDGSKVEEKLKPTKIELSVVDIDVFNDVSITAETHESNVRGPELFRERLSAVRCFREVKRRDIGPVVAGAGGRHGDWVRFEVTFNVQCPKEQSEEKEELSTTKKGKST